MSILTADAKLKENKSLCNIDIKKHREKRIPSEYVSSLSELEECISDTNSTEDMIDAKDLANAISAYLKSLSKESRTLFVCRYFYLDSLKDAAKYCGMTEAKAKSI